MSGTVSTPAVARSTLVVHSPAIRSLGPRSSRTGIDHYRRQRVARAPVRRDQLGRISIGSAAEISRIERIIDEQLEQRIRNARTALADLATTRRALSQIVTLLNDPGVYPRFQ